MYPVGGPGQQGPGPVGPPGGGLPQNPLGGLTVNPGSLGGLPGGLSLGTGLGPSIGGPSLGNHMAPGQTQLTNPSAAVNPLTTALGTMISPPGQTTLQGIVFFCFNLLIISSAAAKLLNMIFHIEK